MYTDWLSPILLLIVCILVDVISNPAILPNSASIVPEIIAFLAYKFPWLSTAKLFPAAKAQLWALESKLAIIAL